MTHESIETSALEEIRRLRESEALYRDLYENAPIAYSSISANGRIQRTNRRAVEMFGYALKDLIGRPIFDLYADTPSGKAKAHKVFERFQKGEEIRNEELEMQRADGRCVWISLTVQPVKDVSGHIVASRSMAIDITDRKQTEQLLLDEVKDRYDYEEIIAGSAAFQNVVKQAEQVAKTNATVLVLGETGTGKELVCRTIHHKSPRSARPLVKINCAAIPHGLVESELFGHEKGAFTGAIARRQGRFELADGGTIFLDEIGDLPLEAQAKLLQVLEEQAFERVGGTQTIRVDTRIIAATHQNLEQMVEDGSFRQDLFYRLNIFPITLPPLRNRKEDIPLLASYFIRRACARLGRQALEPGEGVLAHLRSYSWPGNVRELENIIERTVILCGNKQTLDRADIQLDTSTVPPDAGQIQSLQTMEKEHIVAALQATNGKVSGKGGAAQFLGLKPTTLESRMKKLGIRRRFYTGS